MNYCGYLYLKSLQHSYFNFSYFNFSNNKNILIIISIFIFLLKYFICYAMLQLFNLSF